MGKLAFASFAIAAVALGACSSMAGKGPGPDPNIYPKDWQNEVINTLTNSLDDPNGIRQASITEPMLKQAGSEQRYVVCMRFDSRDLNRQYLGLQERIAWFYAGRLNQLVKAEAGQCAGAPYKPWPELEKYCLTKKCT
jgi:hypothetical protein